MSREIGSLKTGGRTKGTPNKKTQMLSELLEDSGIVIHQMLAELLPILKPEKQADILLGLMAYIYPKRKAIDLVVEKEEDHESLKIQFINPDGSVVELKRPCIKCG